MNSRGEQVTYALRFAEALMEYGVTQRAGIGMVRYQDDGDEDAEIYISSGGTFLCPQDLRT